MSDEFLYQFQKQPSLQFTHRLYNQINEKPATKTRVVQKLAYVGVSIVLVIGLIMVLSPAVRVHAQEIIYTIGQWIIDHKPTAAEQFEEKLAAGVIQENEPLLGDAIEWQAPEWMSINDAEELTGITVYEIPLDENLYKPLFREVHLPVHERDPLSVTTTFWYSSGYLTLRQTKIDAPIKNSQLSVGDALVQEVPLLGGEGTWIEGLRLSTYVNEENGVEPEYANVLIWELDGNEFWLQSSPGLSFDEMRIAAEGIH